MSEGVSMTDKPDGKRMLNGILITTAFSTAICLIFFLVLYVLAASRGELRDVGRPVDWDYYAAPAVPAR
jgi:hypothetical protein